MRRRSTVAAARGRERGVRLLCRALPSFALLGAVAMAGALSGEGRNAALEREASREASARADTAGAIAAVTASLRQDPRPLTEPAASTR